MRELKNKLETERREDKRAVLQGKVSRNVTKLTAACRERENVSFSGGAKKPGVSQTKKETKKKRVLMYAVRREPTREGSVQTLLAITAYPSSGKFA